MRDAILFSVGTNSTHGRPRKNADKRQAVITMLLNPLVSKDDKGNSWADRAIARWCNVSEHLVENVRVEMAPANSRRCVSYERGGQTVTMVTGSEPEPDDAPGAASRRTSPPRPGSASS